MDLHGLPCHAFRSDYGRVTRKGDAMMSIVSRSRGEMIRIGSDIVVCIVDIKGGQARIGVKAAREVQVHREEMYLGIPPTRNSDRERNEE